MATTVETRTPVHLWIVGIVSLLWNCFGCYDYLMTRMRNTDSLAAAMPGADPSAILAWVDAFPLYAQAGWGLGVWMGLAGTILLLARHRWAVPAFGLSLIGAVIGLGYQIVAAPPVPGPESPTMKIIPYVIIAVALGLFLYARAMQQKGVIR